jgi:DNA-binding LacI/PurR family transcriptional regulator
MRSSPKIPPDAKPSRADNSERRRLQMADIARLAGVSVSTVSRALNGSPLVNDETKERVATLARSLNYSINLGAKNLRLQRNQTIAVVIPYDAASRQHISDPFFLAMLGSLADALTDRGYDMLVSRVDAESLGSAAQPYDSGVAVGIVLIGQWRHHDQLNALAARKVPLVVWGAQLPQQLYCSVGGDNVLGGRLATEHLLAQGRRRIAFLGDPQLPEVAHRLKGYRQALRARKLPELAELELAVPFDVTSARAAIEGLLARGVAFDAVLGCSDLLAITAMQVLREQGKRVPQDVAVVGYDDMPLAAYCDPPLTSVNQPVGQAGIELVDALLALLKHQSVPPRTLAVSLSVRHSSRAAA